MLPSVCAARLRGCTAMPASIAAQKFCTLILPVVRSSETSATPAASVSSFTMVPTPSARAVALARPVRHLGDDAQQMLHARHALGEFEPERDRVLAEILGDLVEKALDRERVVAVADAAPRRQPRAAVLDHMLGELVGDRILRDRRALHDDAVLSRARIAGRIGHDRIRRRRGGARRRACRRRRSRPRCGAPSSAGICRTPMSSSRVQISFTGLPTALASRTASSTASCLPRRPKPPPRKCWCSVMFDAIGLEDAPRP